MCSLTFFGVHVFVENRVGPMGPTALARRLLRARLFRVISRVLEATQTKTCSDDSTFDDVSIDGLFDRNSNNVIFPSENHRITLLIRVSRTGLDLGQITSNEAEKRCIMMPKHFVFTYK